MSKSAIELDRVRLEAYLQQQIPGFSDLQEIQRLRGGQSNPNWLLVTQGARFVLRSQPPGKLLRSAHAMDREYRVLSSLSSTDVPVPEVYHYCGDTSVIGVTFYVMGYVAGNISHNFHLPELSLQQRRDTYLNMTRALAALHKVDVTTAGLQDFGKKGNYFQRQFHRWSKQYTDSLPEGVPALDELRQWLAAHLPKQEASRTIVHGDYRLDNLVFEPTSRQVAAILDWELSTLGDPLSDLGYFLGVLNLPADFPIRGFGGLDRQSLGIPAERELLEVYLNEMGLAKINNWPFYKAFGFFRLAAIAAGLQRRVNLGIAVDPTSKLYGSLTGKLAEIGLQQALDQQ